MDTSLLKELHHERFFQTDARSVAFIGSGGFPCVFSGWSYVRHERPARPRASAAGSSGSAGGASTGWLQGILGSTAYGSIGA